MAFLVAPAWLNYNVQAMPESYAQQIQRERALLETGKRVHEDVDHAAPMVADAMAGRANATHIAAVSFSTVFGFLGGSGIAALLDAADETCLMAGVVGGLAGFAISHIGLEPERCAAVLRANRIRARGMKKCDRE
jgi:hypothetical protein